jgi:hypothetical protein
MLIKDFYVVPENNVDEKFVDEEIGFLIDVSIRNRNSFKNNMEYKEVVEERYNSWLEKNNEATISV